MLYFRVLRRFFYTFIVCPPQPFSPLLFRNSKSFYYLRACGSAPSGSQSELYSTDGSQCVFVFCDTRCLRSRWCFFYFNSIVESAAFRSPYSGDVSFVPSSIWFFVQDSVTQYNGDGAPIVGACQDCSNVHSNQCSHIRCFFVATCSSHLRQIL